MAQRKRALVVVGDEAGLVVSQFVRGVSPRVQFNCAPSLTSAKYPTSLRRRPTAPNAFRQPTSSGVVSMGNVWVSMVRRLAYRRVMRLGRLVIYVRCYIQFLAREKSSRFTSDRARNGDRDARCLISEAGFSPEFGFGHVRGVVV